MPSERIQRRVDAFLDEAEAAAARREWAATAEAARAVLAIDPGNGDAQAFLKMAEANGATTATAPPSAALAPPPAAPLPAPFAGGRYRALRLLGQGGRKRVYLARDERLGREVALAVVPGEALSAAERERFQREARAMARLGGHPHLVAIHDIGEERGGLYTVQEYMSGGDLAGLLAKAEEQRLATATALAVAKDVCRALAAIHQAGIVHRDLKPANVFLGADGAARVGDFGLAAGAEGGQLTQHGTMLGTVAYMPPEQALGGEATPRCDLYSLGCVLYELVTGRPPFVGGDPTTVISQHLNTPPVAPSLLAPCPASLEKVILGLLEKDPAKRPATAAAVLAALDAVNPAEAPARHSGENPLARLSRGVFVGREKELERLRTAFDEAFAGRGGLVMLVGEPGIGKTRTCQELETYARVRGATVLWGRNHESSGAPPYWPWLQAGRQWSAAADPLALAAAMNSGGWELVRLFPELRGAPGFAEPPVPLDQTASQFRLFDAYTSFIHHASLAKPLVLALDDLHWADKPTLLLLEHLAREVGRMRVLVLCTFRDTDLVRTHPLSEALAEVGRDPGFERIVLRGLSQGEVRSYIAAAAGSEPGVALVDRIYEETEGNPFFLAEVVNLLAEEGALAAGSVSNMRIPDGVREALGRRLDRVSKEANALLQLAAVVGREFGFDALRPLDAGSGPADPSGEGDEAILRSLEEGLEARVIEELPQPGCYRFTHALMQETLLGELSTTRRVRLHGRVAEALERAWGTKAVEHAAGLASHFGESATLTPAHGERARRYARLAGQAAEAQSAWAEAVRWYRAAIADEEEPDPDLLGALARCLARSLGAWQFESGEVLARAVEGYRRRGDRAGLARAVAAYPTTHSDASARRPLLVEAIEAAADLDDQINLELRIRLLMAVAVTPEEPGSGEVMERLESEIFELSESPGVSGGAPIRLLTQALRRSFQGDPVDAAELQSAAGPAFERLGAIEHAEVSYSGCSPALAGGNVDLAERMSAALAALSKRYRLGTGQIFVDCNNVERALLHWDIAAIEVAEYAIGRFGAASFVAARMHALRGDMAAFRKLSDELLQLERPDQQPRMVVLQYSAILAWLHFVRRELEQAKREFSDWAMLWRAGAGFPQTRAASLAHLDLCIEELGDESLWREVYDEIQGWKNWVGFWTGVGLDPIRGRLALRLGLVDEAEQAFREGLEWAERYSCPVEAGRNLQGLAAVAERRGDRAGALTFLDRAAGYYAPRGVKLYLDQVIAKKVELQGIISNEMRSSIAAVSAAVQSEHPDLSHHAAPDGTVTIMFTDIEGSTALNVALGDDRWVALLAEHNRHVRTCVAAHGGFEVKTEGDAFMVAFGSARAALRCALDIQRTFPASPPGPASSVLSPQPSVLPPVRVRIGLHTGEPVKQGDDFFGTHVVLASRIAGQASGGEVLVSALVRELLAPSGEFTFDEGREVETKGLAGAHRVYAVRAE